jgi:cyclophilin family peptidyl-prolyl cis-trans isomerase/HEAT repeat protein
MFRYSFFLFAALLWFSACLPPGDETLSDVHLSIRDSLFQKIHDLQDRRSVDSLYPYFTAQDPTYRYLAAMAMASIRDSSALDSLYTLLDDAVQEVQVAAAYAIGQIGNTSSVPRLIGAFAANDTSGVWQDLNRTILEAVGKCGTAEHLRSLSTVTTYTRRDTGLLLGQVRGIYQFALREVVSPDGTARMATLASNLQYPDEVRLYAAHYLARTPGIDLAAYTRNLIDAVEGENNVNVRMALIIGLGKCRTPEALSYLQQRFALETDYRVRCNILRAFGNFAYEQAKAIPAAALRDANLHVAQRAAQYFLDYGQADDATLYWRWAKDSLAWPVQTTLYKAANHHLPVYYQDYRNSMNSELRQRFVRANDPYEKADALSALAEFGWNYQFVEREALIHPSAAVRTAGIRALKGITRLENFDRLFGGARRRVTGELAATFVAAIRGGEPGMVAEAAEALHNPDREFRLLLADSIGILQRSLRQLKLPSQIETYRTLAETINFLRGWRPPEPEPVPYNHPINWAILEEVDSTNLNVVIETVKGTIKLQLFPLEAPGTVSSFVSLAKDGFYNGNELHRVVPNFVVQGGCPDGDGYGGPPYTIRTELPQLYYRDSGYVGMARSDYDTEGSQFFITHSPTPHLDGKYTIFGRVTEGMDIVHRLQIGDDINQVTVQ